MAGHAAAFGTEAAGYGAQVGSGAGAVESDDVLVQLERDHADIQRLLGMFDGQAPDIAAELFWILADDLIRHEVAEEVVLYPHLPAGSDTPARVGLAEQVAIEDQLTRLEGMATASGEFRREFAALRAAVALHIEGEEHDLVPRLYRTVSEDRRRELGRQHHRGPGGRALRLDPRFGQQGAVAGQLRPWAPVSPGSTLPGWECRSR
jgi:hypothetical protein